MSTSEILDQLPKLSAAERQQVYERLCELQEHDLLHSAGPTPEEKRLLDEALAAYQKDGNRGRPWREVLQKLRNRKAS